MPDRQTKRYEIYRRAHLPKPAMKKILTSLLGQPVQPSSVIVVAGVAKVFVGEVVEMALGIREETRKRIEAVDLKAECESGEEEEGYVKREHVLEGPLTPQELRHAYTLLTSKHKRIYL